MHSKVEADQAEDEECCRQHHRYVVVIMLMQTPQMLMPHWLSGGGEVCMEFLKVRRGEERVVEVMRVSGDGQRVVIYTPGLSRFAIF